MAKLLTVLAAAGLAVLRWREANVAELAVFGVLAGFLIGIVRRGPRGRCLVESVALGYLAGLLLPAFDGVLPLSWALLLYVFQ
jgi:hypothetical protein